MEIFLFKLLYLNSIVNWNMITSIVAVIVSISALITNRIIARKNILLTIHQAIFKIVSEKAKDCNLLWENEILTKQLINIPPYKVISEVVISTEVIDKSVYLFSENYKSIKKYKDDFYYLLWKQLRTDLRDFIRKADSLAKERDEKYLINQISDLHKVFKKHFERIL